MHKKIGFEFLISDKLSKSLSFLTYYTLYLSIYLFIFYYVVIGLFAMVIAINYIIHIDIMAFLDGIVKSTGMNNINNGGVGGSSNSGGTGGGMNNGGTGGGTNHLQGIADQGYNRPRRTGMSS